MSFFSNYSATFDCEPLRVFCNGPQSK